MKKKQKQVIAVGAGLAAIAAAAAGVYLMTGKNAKNRKKVVKWAGDMQKDVVKELNKAGKASKATYHKIVDTVVKNYKGLKNVKADDVSAVVAELKGSWDKISAEINSASKTLRKAVPKATKSVAKKATKKVAKKVVRKVTKKSKK